MRPHEFIHKYLDAARKASAETGIPTGVLLAIAAHESGWGKSKLSQPPHYNFGGVKRHGNLKGVKMLTTEYVGGKPVKVYADFASYGSPEESFRDIARVLKKPIYKEAQAELEQNNVVGFIIKFAKHYATDPSYAQKIIAVMNKWGLWKL
jgi:flagellar protein FlgJ